jgi:hypothetical protein
VGGLEEALSRWGVPPMSKEVTGSRKRSGNAGWINTIDPIVHIAAISWLFWLLVWRMH